MPQNLIGLPTEKLEAILRERNGYKRRHPHFTPDAQLKSAMRVMRIELKRRKKRKSSHGNAD
jgi:hypothetical protein